MCMHSTDRGQTGTPKYIYIYGRSHPSTVVIVVSPLQKIQKESPLWRNFNQLSINISCTAEEVARLKI